jgi:alkylation response protein AidB-like acyl-CoA dehydrogenase
MELTFTPEEVAFQEQVRTWLAENVPRERRPGEGPQMRAFDLAWQHEQWQAGWAGIAWPKEYGGQGLSLVQQLIWHEEYARAQAPPVGACFVGLNHAGPTLIARATDAQKASHLQEILRGEVVWCQGFSEPDAGSDLASVRTRAVVDGSDLVVTGQKVWTSYGDVAEWQELLVRTDPAAPKHRGLTWLICDMRSPGIEVRPIKTMARLNEFTEVIYDEVHVPLTNVVGEVNDGWNVAMSTLSFERGTAFTSAQVELAQTVERLIDLATTSTGPAGRAAIQDDELSRRLAMTRAEVAALRAMTYLGVSRNKRTGTPGPDGSLIKLYFAELHQRVNRLAMDLIGEDGLYFRSLTEDDGWSGRFLRSFATTIAGGSSEIQRNIIGDRVLGLPR